MIERKVGCRGLDVKCALLMEWRCTCCTGDHVGASAWLALLLWTSMCLGELGIMHQSALIFVLWAMLFSLPALYVASKRALDALIEESFRFIVSAANGGAPHLPALR